MNINEIGKDCVKIAKDHGWIPKEEIDSIEEDKYYLATKVALIHSEVSEMLEAMRVNDWDNLVEEGIDVIIRTFEFLSCLKDVDIEKELFKKMEINRNRSFRHGGKLL